MEEIYEPNSKFNFGQLTLSPPTSILGGNYFIKFQVSGNPLYIQSPKCCTKQGIVKAGKKMYCDLLMSNDHEHFIQWMENLENYSQDYIFKNREKWFETDLEKHDIENSFSSPVKTYKSGKYYTTRTNIPIRLGKSSVKIYDENENDVNIEQIKDTTNIIAIMEVQGIKCSARSFQIEIELKQIMVLKPSNLFEKCIIKSVSQTPDNLTISSKSAAVQETIPIIPLVTQEMHLDENITYKLINIEPNTNDLGLTTNPELNLDDKLADDIFTHQNTPLSNKLDSKNELTEVEFTLDELPENETVQLKTRNDVYYQMYKEAKKKAKLAKDLALSTYLDAKRIKNTYMLDEISDDSDLESILDEDGENLIPSNTDAD